MPLKMKADSMIRMGKSIRHIRVNFVNKVKKYNVNDRFYLLINENVSQNDITMTLSRKVKFLL